MLMLFLSVSWTQLLENIVKREEIKARMTQNWGDRSYLHRKNRKDTDLFGTHGVRGGFFWGHSWGHEADRDDVRVSGQSRLRERGQWDARKEENSAMGRSRWFQTQMTFKWSGFQVWRRTVSPRLPASDMPHFTLVDRHFTHAALAPGGYSATIP